MNLQESEYIHGTQPAEQQRLARLNELLNASSVNALALRGGERILDIGCGPGQLTRAMATVAGPGAYVVGVERSAEQLSEAKSLAQDAGEDHLVELRQGDAGDLPLRPDEWGTFDVVHARFLLEHLRDPQAAVKAMVGALRPGGRIVLEDDDHDILRVMPEPAGFYSLWEAYIETYRHLGNDPYVGRRLVALLHAAGAAPTQNRWLFFGSCAGDSSFGGFVANFRGIIAGARQRILATKKLSPQELEDALAAFENWGTKSDAALWYATCWAQGIRR